jgi:hypothetical protein
MTRRFREYRQLVGRKNISGTAFATKHEERPMKRFPNVTACLIAGASLMALAGITKADDHLFNAMQHGLSGKSPDSHPFVANKAGHGGDLAPGQGSPFAGEETHTPSSLVVSGDPAEGIPPKPHANIKERIPK